MEDVDLFWIAGSLHGRFPLLAPPVRAAVDLGLDVGQRGSGDLLHQRVGVLRRAVQQSLDLLVVLRGGALDEVDRQGQR